MVEVGGQDVWRLQKDVQLDNERVAESVLEAVK